MKGAIDSYYVRGKEQWRPVVNFEKILGDMIALSHWMTPAPFGDTLRQTACGGAAPPNFTFSSALQFDSPAPYAATVEVTDQRTHLLKKLDQHFRSLHVKIDASESHRKYMMLAQVLGDAFDLGVYNLNYDALALLAWPQAFVGFDDKGEFDAAAVHQLREWGFVYHLHGSVHYSLNRLGGGDRIVWRNDLADLDSFVDVPQGYAQEMVSEGKALPRTTLVAGGFKLDQLLVEPFHSLHAALVRHVYEADAVLIGGYGFGDEHVNRALSNRLARRVGSDRIPVMILDRADRCTDPMTYRFDQWSHNLIRTLDAPRDFFREPGHTSPPVPYELAARGSFEASTQHKVALWHGGFVEVSARLKSLVDWLSTGDNSVLVTA